ncbi:hypothetical protein EDC04DRAFT_262064 [Pisolithus marmoratus]|nr:hypothetical protein EDC04DRAFT_262064 [Pisolithus marmoratus]
MFVTSQVPGNERSVRYSNHPVATRMACLDLGFLNARFGPRKRDETIGKFELIHTDYTLGSPTDSKQNWLISWKPNEYMYNLAPYVLGECSTFSYVVIWTVFIGYHSYATEMTHVHMDIAITTPQARRKTPKFHVIITVDLKFRNDRITNVRHLIKSTRHLVLC